MQCWSSIWFLKNDFEKKVTFWTRFDKLVHYRSVAKGWGHAELPPKSEKIVVEIDLIFEGSIISNKISKTG